WRCALYTRITTNDTSCTNDAWRACNTRRASDTRRCLLLPSHHPWIWPTSSDTSWRNTTHTCISLNATSSDARWHPSNSSRICRTHHACPFHGDLIRPYDQHITVG